MYMYSASVMINTLSQPGTQFNYVPMLENRNKACNQSDFTLTLNTKHSEGNLPNMAG